MVADALNPGDMFVGHRIERRIGAGGWGVVYQAHDPEVRRDVAIKLMSVDVPVDERYGEQFRREWCLLAEADHPNVLPVFRAGVERGRPYLVTRLVRGGSLRARLSGGARMSPRHTLHVLTQVAAALDAVHQRGIVHRDVKPENILLDGAHGAEHVWLADFGLARHVVDGRFAVVATGAGTGAYMAPEQRNGGSGAEARTDVYALGVVCYEALTGRPLPRDGSGLPPLPPDADDALSRAYPVVARALATRPADRYPSAGAFVDAARAALAGTQPASWAATTDTAGRPLEPPPARHVPARPGRRARRWRTALLAGAAAAVVLAAAYALVWPGFSEGRRAAVAPTRAEPGPAVSTSPRAVAPPTGPIAGQSSANGPSASRPANPAPSPTRPKSSPPQIFVVCAETATLRADPLPLGQTRVLAELRKGELVEVTTLRDSVWLYGKSSRTPRGWALREWVKPTCG